MIKPHWADITNDPETQGEWKIQLTIIINFISSKDSDEIRTMRIKSNNIEIMMGNEAGKNIEDFFESLLQKYEEGLGEKVKEVSLFLIVLIYCIIIFIK